MLLVRRNRMPRASSRYARGTLLVITSIYSMHIRSYAASFAAASLVALPMLVSADTLAVSCIGTPGVNSIAWAASPNGGVQPYSYLWDSGSTSSSQVVSAAPGAHSTTIQVTDASSTVATATCSTNVLAAPVITSFSSNPVAITAGQGALLSWSVSGATSVSLSGLGAQAGNSATVTPVVTTTYLLTASNSGGVATSSATVMVTAATTTPSTLSQIQALLQQIMALKAQIMSLLKQQGMSGGSTASSTPQGGCPTFTNGLGLGHERDDDRPGCGHEKEWRTASSSATSFVPHLEGKHKQKGKQGKKGESRSHDD